jgi:uncharacterized protein YdeI (YjbR/CyaY-like superfamily)
MKECSTFLAIKEMQMKTSHSRVAIIEKTNNMLARMQGKRNPYILLVGM